MQPSFWFAFPLLSISSAVTPPDPAQSSPGAGSTVPRPEVVGPAFRFGDFDADGLDDVYVIDPLSADKLFRNLGTGAFADVTVEQGLEGITGTRMALWFDFDGDQGLDLYVSHASGLSRLYQNTYRGRFVDVTSVSGLAHEGRELFAEALDYDADERPDLHLVTEHGDLLFRNLGGGQFERASLPALASGATIVGGAQLSTAFGAPADVMSASGVQPSSPAAGSSDDAAKPSSLGEARSSFAAPGSAARGSLGPPSASGTYTAICTPTIDDQASANCIQASSVPGTLGLLYPLSTNLFVSAAGRVGVGTSAPSTKFHVVDNANGTLASFESSTSSASIDLNCTAVGGRLWSLTSNNSGVFGVYDNFLQPYMTIHRSPNLGVSIGSTTPESLLHIMRSSAGTVTADPSTLLTLEASGNNYLSLITTDLNERGILFGGPSNNKSGGIYYNTGFANQGFDFRTNGDANRMTIESDGSVGIGTPAPEGLLHVRSGSAGNVTADASSSLVLERNGSNYLSILSPDANERGILFGEPSATLAGGIVFNSSLTPDGLAFRTGGNINRMVLTSAGGLGIGTAGDSEKLSVAGGIHVDYTLQNNGSFTNALRFGNASSGEAIGSKKTAGGNQNGLDFHTNFLPRMSISNAGLVGIGTTAPGNKLQVVDSGSTVVSIQGSNTGGTWLDIGNTTGRNWALLSTGSANGEGPGAFCIHDHNVATTRLVIDTAGNVGIGRVPTGNRLEVQGDACKTSGGSTWLVCSDRRIKTEIATIENALDTIDALRLVEYRYTPEYLAANPGTEDKVYYNVIAQEYAEVFPDYVKGRESDGILQVDTHPALMHAIAAVQELKGIVEAKDREIVSLRDDCDRELASMRARIAQMEESVAALAASK